MKLLVASGNLHKKEELSNFFVDSKINFESASEKIPVVEDGETFFENAFLKAKAYYEKFKEPVVSDDSGLVVNALPGELGIHSARFGGEGLTDQERSELLLDKLKESENRDAYFICVLCVYLNDEEVFYFEGRSHGIISKEIRGLDGFGYDGVFIPEKNPSKSYAEDKQWKRLNSHRAKASLMMKSFFDARLG